MKLSGLLLIVSLVLADNDVSFHGIDQICPKDTHCVTNGDENFICENSNIHNCSFLDEEYPDVPESFFNIPETCNIYKSNQLNCSWSTHELPEGAQYSAFFHSCTEEKNYKYQPLHCSSNSDRKRAECHGQLFKPENVMVHVSISNHSLMFCKTFLHADIEILVPPRNITAFTESQNLEIQWLQPNDHQTHCFDYELNINNDTLIIPKVLTYTKQNIDLTRTYSIKIRSKWKILCASNNNWGEWSKILVVGPTEKPYPLNWYVIVSIAFVLPMILLAFLLVCKFQKLSKKLFPSIPGPSENVKKLLQKEDFSQVMPPKQGGFEAEEGTQIVQVTS